MGLLDLKTDLGLLGPVTGFITDIKPKKREYIADTVDLARLIDAETDTIGGRTSSQGAYGFAQFMPSTWRNLEKDSEVTGVDIPDEIKGKGFKEVMDDIGSAKIAARTYLRMLERYLERRGLPVTVRNILGSYNVGPTLYASRLRRKGEVPFHLWDRWISVGERNK